MSLSQQERDHINAAFDTVFVMAGEMSYHLSVISNTHEYKTLPPACRIVAALTLAASVDVANRAQKSMPSDTREVMHLLLDNALDRIERAKHEVG